MTTYQQAARATHPAPVPSNPPDVNFQYGYQSGAQAANQEMSHGVAPLTADALFTFIETRLDPLQQARQRDATKNPIPLAYHAGFVAGYLTTLFAPGLVEDQQEGRTRP